MTKEYDLVVLGGGSGGYVAAIRASQLGMKVALVEANKLGGTCLHQGCIPTKTLLRTAELYRNLALANKFGINVTVNKIDFNEVRANKSKIIQELHQGIQLLMEKNKIDVFKGYGRILGPSIFSPLPGTISVEYESGVENTMLVPKNVLIASGSKPRLLPNVEVDGNYIITSNEALEMKELPSSLVIIGAGIIGIEWASILVDLGVDVTVVESERDILSNEDDDVKREVKKQLAKRGVTFYMESTVQENSIRIENNEVIVPIEVAEEVKDLSTEKLLLAIGREPNVDDLGLQNTNIEIESGFIGVNEYYQTKEQHIYAIGDCIGGLQLAHVASEEGILAVEHMAGEQVQTLKEEQIPVNIYAYPEVAKIGLNEREANKQYGNIKVGKFPLKGIGKAHVFGEIEGFMKIISDQKTDDILGVHIVGPQATELMGEASLAKFLDASTWELSKTIHAHPSLSELFQEAALATRNNQIHS